MTGRRLSLTVFVILTALCVAQSLYYYSLLPDRMASHFGSSGRPDAWSSKAEFVTFYLAIIGLLIVLFPGIAFGISSIPVSLMSLPNKEYWLSPEHRQETFDFLFQHALWLGSAALVFLIDIFHQVFRVNMGKTNALDHPMLSIGIFAAFTTVWVIGLFIKFRGSGRVA